MLNDSIVCALNIQIETNLIVYVFPRHNIFVIKGSQFVEQMLNVPWLMDLSKLQVINEVLILILKLSLH